MPISVICPFYRTVHNEECVTLVPLLKGWTSLFVSFKWRSPEPKAWKRVPFITENFLVGVKNELAGGWCVCPTYLFCFLTCQYVCRTCSYCFNFRCSSRCIDNFLLCFLECCVESLTVTVRVVLNSSLRKMFHRIVGVFGDVNTSVYPLFCFVFFTSKQLQLCIFSCMNLSMFSGYVLPRCCWCVYGLWVQTHVGGC